MNENTFKEKLEEYLKIQKEIYEMRKKQKDHKNALGSLEKEIQEYMVNNTLNSVSTTHGEIILYDNGSVEIHSSSITTAHPNQTQGLENDLGTIATVVSGRNSTSWTTSGDA